MVENLKRRFTAVQFRNVLCLSLLIAAGITALGPIRSSRAIGQYESRSTEDDRWRQRDNFAGTTPTATVSCPGFCCAPASFHENFDNVTPPALPAGWLATNALGPLPLWVTSNSGVPGPPADTPPNAAFIDDPLVVSDKRLDSSLVFFAECCCAQLAFQHNFNLEASDIDPTVGFDGGVLEISTDGGNTFRDILVAGGSFVAGGYNRTISTDRGSPIAGRQAWSGNSGGFITTVIDLPFIPISARLRWRMASDNSGSGEGWRVDTINISWCELVPCPTPTPHYNPTPRPRPTQPPRPNP
jgi:hypothetical protein